MTFRDILISALYHDGWATEDGKPKPILNVAGQPVWVKDAFKALEDLTDSSMAKLSSDEETEEMIEIIKLSQKALLNSELRDEALNKITQWLKQ